MDLFDVDGMQLPLSACAKTLKSLQLYPFDPRGKESSLNRGRVLADDLIAGFYLRDFDLSRNESLRELRVTASSTNLALSCDWPDAASNFLKYALATVRTPLLSRIMVTYQDWNFRGVEPCPLPGRPPFREMCGADADRAEEASQHQRLFEVFREVLAVQAFSLELWMDVWDSLGEYSVGVLKEAVAAEKARKGFKDFLSEPSVAYYPRRALR